MQSWVVFALALGILPSWTALTHGLAKHFPALFSQIGPLNPLKILAPILAIELWRNRSRFEPKLVRWGLSLLLAGTLATIIAGVPCGFPSTLTREWILTVVGALSAGVYLTLPDSQRSKVLWFWGIAIYSLCLLDFAAPRAINWLYDHVFDPNTRMFDAEEIGTWALTGVFGRQSLAKLLVWIPWIFLIHAWSKPLRPKTLLSLFGVGILSTGLILATTQRGPLLGAAMGWVALSIHQAIQMGNKKLAVAAGGSLLAGIALIFIVVPRPVLEARFLSAIGLAQKSRYSNQAEVNSGFRMKMAKFSIDVIKTHPWGHACIPKEEFDRAGVYFANHAHNMVLQQFRERGWIWGALHLALWILATWGAWRQRTNSGSAAFAAICATWVIGMFDHPWTVLNHALILWILILSGLRGIPGFNVKSKSDRSADAH